METERDIIRVKGEPPVEVTFKYTRQGPVLHEDPERNVAYALRAAWREIGCAPYLASLRINQAKDWSEFHDACRYHRAPSVNMVWADRAGNIGWQVVAIAPVRRKWSGLVPVPGTGVTDGTASPSS
jgi:penicillin amidase